MQALTLNGYPKSQSVYRVYLKPGIRNPEKKKMKIRRRENFNEG